MKFVLLMKLLSRCLRNYYDFVADMLLGWVRQSFAVVVNLSAADVVSVVAAGESWC